MVRITPGTLRPGKRAVVAKPIMLIVRVEVIFVAAVITRPPAPRGVPLRKSN